MAETIAIFLITAIAGAGAATGITLAVTTLIVGLAISMGISVLAQLFLNRAPEAKPSERQFIVAAPVVPRVRAYGRVRLAGAQIFIATWAGVLMRVVAHHDGQVTAVEEHVIDDTVVDIDDDGWVTTAPWGSSVGASSSSVIRVRWRHGESDPAPYSDLHTRVPEWNTTALGRGVAHSLTEFWPVELKNFTAFYPNGERTSYKQTLLASPVWDPRDPDQDPDDAATWGWSDNVMLVVLDHQRHRTGMRLPLDWITPEIDAWKAAADLCDELVPLKGGGYVKRYRAWGSYSYDERPGDVQSRLLAACNGRLMFGPNGGIVPSVGVWTQPTVELDDDAITDYDLTSGSEGPDATNYLTASYVEPGLGYVESDAEPWIDTAAVAAYGEQRQDAKLFMVPSHSQARRLMKQAAAKLAPAWQGTIKTNLRGLVALSERFIRIRIAEADVVFTAEIDRVEFIIENGSVVTGLVIVFTAMDASAFEFDAETEEGTPSATPSPIVASGLSGVANFDVLIESRGSYAVAVASWSELVDYLTVQVEYRITGSGNAWQLAPMSTGGGTTIETGPLTDGASYDFRAQVRGGSQFSPYTSIVTRVVIVDAMAPAAPTNLAVSISGSAATIEGDGVPSENMHGVRVFRATTSSVDDASLVHTIYVGPGVAFAWTDAGLAAGTYWWWCASINLSGVESARALAGTQTAV